MIRRASIGDLPRLMEVYACARAFMVKNGNPTQWSANYPGEERLLSDIAAGYLYALTDDSGEIHGCFMLMPGPDETYGIIEQGDWCADRPYGVIHRVASDGTCRHVLRQCVAFATQAYRYLRIDTHKDNLPMQRALAAEEFCYRGIIYTHDGTPRLAYDRLQA